MLEESITTGLASIFAVLADKQDTHTSYCVAGDGGGGEPVPSAAKMCAGWGKGWGVCGVGWSGGAGLSILFLSGECTNMVPVAGSHVHYLLQRVDGTGQNIWYTSGGTGWR